MGRRRGGGNRIHGWLVLDKPIRMTSNQAVDAVYYALRPSKIGHAGTLDPLATGVLTIALGRATKTVPRVMAQPKRYRFRVRFGEERATDDAEGEVLQHSEARPTTDALEAALPAFVGEIQQVPPSFAAIHVAGERAYDKARRGESFQLAARTIRIDALRLLERVDQDEAEFEVDCGQGTYVRSLARDLGRTLGCFGHASMIRRTRVGAFHVEDAISPADLEAIQDPAERRALVQPLEVALQDLPVIELTPDEARRQTAGLRIPLPPARAHDGLCRATCDGTLVALVRVEDGVLVTERGFGWTPPPHAPA